MLLALVDSSLQYVSEFIAQQIIIRGDNMELSKVGLNLIKKYEGLRLKAYKPVSTEEHWTIGYGHYGADVREGMTITEAQAEEFLKKDCASAVKAVNALKRNFTQNQFDALVSFTYNCGAGNLRKLCKDRTIEEIGEKIVLYNKAGGKVLNGLVRRRNEEQALYKKGASSSTYFPKYTGTTYSIVNALQSLKIDSNYNYRKTIAKVNNISDYSGTPEQNTRMLNLLKEGKLVKP